MAPSIPRLKRKEVNMQWGPRNILQIRRPITDPKLLEAIKNALPLSWAEAEALQAKNRSLAVD